MPTLEHQDEQEHVPQREQPGTSNAQNDDANTPFSRKEERRSKARRVAIVMAVALLLAAGGIAWYLHSRTYEVTDDAQVDGHIDPITSNIAGTVTAVFVQDNDHVNAGQPLVNLDVRPLLANVVQSRAQLEQAVAQLQAQKPNVPIARSNIQADVSSDYAQLTQALAAVAGAESDREEAAAKLTDAQAQDTRDQQQYLRYKQLYDKQEVAREDVERYAAAAASSNANVVAAKAALVSTAKTVDQRLAQAAAQRIKRDQDARNAPQQLQIRQADIKIQQAIADAAKAVLEKANLNLSFTKITAPVNGIVAQRSAELGAHITEGGQLMMLVETGDLWITADFKETQLQHMLPQQAAKVHIDALDTDFNGYVESMPAITGARSSVLPPENATGNYVKVVQRLPVRIRLKPNQKDLGRLRPGMSAEARVSLR